MHVFWRRLRLFGTFIFAFFVVSRSAAAQDGDLQPVLTYVGVLEAISKSYDGIGGVPATISIGKQGYDVLYKGRRVITILDERSFPKLLRSGVRAVPFLPVKFTATQVEAIAVIMKLRETDPANRIFVQDDIASVIQTDSGDIRIALIRFPDPDGVSIGCRQSVEFDVRREAGGSPVVVSQKRDACPDNGNRSK